MSVSKFTNPSNNSELHIIKDFDGEFYGIDHEIFIYHLDYKRVNYALYTHVDREFIYNIDDIKIDINTRNRIGEICKSYSVNKIKLISSQGLEKLGFLPKPSAREFRGFFNDTILPHINALSCKRRYSSDEDYLLDDFLYEEDTSRKDKTFQDLAKKVRERRIMEDFREFENKARDIISDSSVDDVGPLRKAMRNIFAWFYR